MDFNKVWIPKQRKRQETIWFYFPVIKYPVTKREIISFSLGLPFVYPIFKVGAFLFPPADVIDRVVILLYGLIVPILFVFLSHKKTDNKYVENIIFTKVKYRKNATVVLNEKAMRQLKKK